MREVFNRSDADDVARQLHKVRFGAFLSAKNIILERRRDAGATAAELAEKYHCGNNISVGGVTGSSRRCRSVVPCAVPVAVHSDEFGTVRHVGLHANVTHRGSKYGSPGFHPAGRPR